MSVAPYVAVLLLWCAASSGQTYSDEVSAGVLRANGVAHRSRLQELHYYEDMPVNFTCARTPPGPDSRTSVQISYFSKETGAVSTWFQLQDSVDMYIKLTVANNDTLLTCSIKDDSKNDSNIIQMRLLLRTLLYDEGFEVNGLLVARRADSGKPNGSNGKLLYEYHYFWEERMTVRLVKDARKYSAARCTVSGYNFPGPWLDHVNADVLSSSMGLYLVNTTLLMQQSGTTVTCHLWRTAAAYLTRSYEEMVMEIIFIYYDLVPFVGGLSMANVMLLYKDNVTQITYDNDMTDMGNGTHYLTCNPDGPATKSMWIFVPSQVDYSGATYPNSFRMKDDVKWSLIKCMRKSDDTLIPPRIVNLWLHRRDELPPTKLLTPNRDAESTWWLPAVAVAASLAALVCVALAVSVVWWRPRWFCKRGTASDSSGVCNELHAPSSRSYCDGEEPQYEVIPELPTASGVPASISQRPPQPLPAAALEESGGGGRYQHYDTPYEWRIFRFGVRRCACGRCPISG